MVDLWSEAMDELMELEGRLRNRENVDAVAVEVLKARALLSVAQEISRLGDVLRGAT